MHRPETNIEKKVRTETDPFWETLGLLLLEHRKIDTVQQPVNSECHTPTSELFRTKGSSLTVFKDNKLYLFYSLSTEENFDTLAVVYCHLKHETLLIFFLFRLLQPRKRPVPPL
jgi:hypothetical protein